MLLLERVTVEPPVGALLPSVTVPRDVLPPCTLVGLTVRDDNAGAFTVSTAEVIPPAVIVEVVVDETGVVVMVKLAVVAPALTVTLNGTWAADVRLELSVTAMPPVGAAPVRLTVPVEETPPETEVGEKLTDFTCAGTMVRFADAVPL